MRKGIQMSRFFSIITHGNVTPDFYINNIDALRKRKSIMLKIAFTCATIVNIGLLIATFTVPILYEVRNFYYFFTIWFIVWTAIVYAFLPRHTIFAKFFYSTLRAVFSQ